MMTMIIMIYDVLSFADDVEYNIDDFVNLNFLE